MPMDQVSSGNITVTIVIDNSIGYDDEPFRYSVDVTGPKRELIYFLQAAADMDPAYKFSATYFAAPLGYSIDVINGVRPNYQRDKHYWQITDGNLKPFDLGVSSYVPYDKETIIFRVFQDDGSHQ